MRAATLLCRLGEGLSSSLQAVALSVITVSQNAVLSASVAVIDTVAKLIGGPFMAFLFSIGDADGHSLGFCYLLSVVSISRHVSSHPLANFEKCLFAMLLVTSCFVPRLPAA